MTVGNAVTHQARRVAGRLRRDGLRGGRFVSRVLCRIDPSSRLLARLTYSLSKPTAVCVYRYANAANVTAVARQVEELGGTVRLWALDQSHPDLTADTVGVGPGGRFQHVNQMLSSIELGEGHLVVFDDDVSLAPGGLRQFLALMGACALELAQPAHGADSVHSFDFNRRRPFSAVRETTFVEIGPMFAVSPDAVDRFLPLPERTVMGYGTEADWYDQHLAGARLGVVDAVEMRHLGAVASGYGDTQRAEIDAGRAALRERGFQRWQELQRCLKVHRPWNLLRETG